MTSEILLFVIKLVLGGFVAFLAILLMSKTRDASSMFLVTGFLISYAAIVYELLLKLGILTVSKITIWNIPLTSLLCVAVPAVCFIVAFILMIAKK